MAKTKRTGRVKKDLGGMSDVDVKVYLGNAIWEAFRKWIGGQTCPVLRDGRYGYYEHDVERFADSVLKGRPTYFD